MAQLPLADTIVDMATAFFVTIFTGIVLYIVLKHREKSTVNSRESIADAPDRSARAKKHPPLKQAGELICGWFIA